MDELFELQKKLIAQYEKLSLYKRQYYDRITLDNYSTGIVGSRGVGKRTL